MKWLRSVAVSCALLAGIAGGFQGRALGAGKAEHVIMIVWDGMRPDFISPQYTPTLYDLALKGVYFKNHHSVFVTSTEVNGAAFATGDYPNRHGIFANRLYWSDMNWLDSSATESVDVIRRGDAMTAGHYIAVPTVTELLQQTGASTVVAGSKPVAILLDRFQRRTLPAAQESVLLYAGRTIPSGALAQAVKVNDKEFPAAATPNKARDAWTTKALTDAFWKNGVPKFSVLWLSEPDASQHASGPGSDNALAGLESSDQCLAAVLKTLEEKKVLDKTDLFIVSDHAFSTVQRGVDLAETLKKAKFKAASRFDDPEPGNVLIVGLGGAAAFYVIDRDEEVHRRLVRFLQGTDFVGVIFSRLPMPGTFPLAQVRLDTATASPDIVISMRWNADKSESGAPGMVIADGGKKGTGTHSSLSRFDLHNTLVASGPDFRQGMIDELPSGNPDLAPTILWILGAPPAPMDGRVLAEALVAGDAVNDKPEHKTVEADADVGLRRWHQYLTFTTLGSQIYFDEGNGESSAK